MSVDTYSMIVSVLLTVIGFFCSFLLYMIFSKLSSTEEKLITMLGRLEGLEQKHISNANMIDILREQLNNKCDITACPARNKP
jgi:hypothetical protein